MTCRARMRERERDLQKGETAKARQLVLLNRKVKKQPSERVSERERERERVGNNLHELIRSAMKLSECVEKGSSYKRESERVCM